MLQEVKKQWDNRYREAEYAYGTLPNEFLKLQLEQLKPGKILFAAEGEGRNAVYAAKNGWDVCAFDISTEGQIKANKLASSHSVSIDYCTDDFLEIDYQKNQFDAIVLIYAHFPPGIKSTYHKQLNTLLKPGGTIILEGFSKNHLPLREKNPSVGGPGNPDFLFSLEEIKADFPNCEIIELVETEIELNEGLYHIGRGSVIRFIGRKK